MISSSILSIHEVRPTDQSRHACGAYGADRHGRLTHLVQGSGVRRCFDPTNTLRRHSESGVRAGLATSRTSCWGDLFAKSQGKGRCPMTESHVQFAVVLWRRRLVLQLKLPKPLTSL